MDFAINFPILNHMKFFQLLGFCTISLDSRHNQQKVEKILSIWSVISVVAVMVVTLAIFIGRNNILFIGDNFGELNDISKFVCVAFAYEVSLIEAVLSRKHDRCFWNKYVQLQKERSNKFNEKPIYRYRNFFWSFYGYIATKIVCELSFVMAIRHREQWLNNWLIFTPSALITAFRMMQIILYIELIRDEVKDLNLRLISLRRRCKRLRGAALGSEFRKAASGWSAASNFVKSYIIILTNFYWTFWIVYYEDELIEYLLLIPAILEMVFPLVISRNCMREAIYTSYHVHRLRHPIEWFRFSVLIESFSLQIFHQKLEINAYGLFAFDCKILKQVLGSIAVYMLFFIQFMPKFGVKLR